MFRLIKTLQFIIPLNSFLYYYSRDEWKERKNLDHRIKNFILYFILYLLTLVELWQHKADVDYIFSWNSLGILTLIVFLKQQTATARDFQAFSRVFLISRAGLLRRSRG